MQIYADNAATTKMSKAVIDTMAECMKNIYGNPSSIHSLGQQAAEQLAKDRESIARILGAEPSEIIFTCGGSEADNQAIRSAALWGKKNGKMHLISTAFEHHAVLHMLKKLEAEGFLVTLLPVHEDGIVQMEDLRAAVREDTALVSVMFANNEIGTIQPISEIGAFCREAGIIFHSDAVQAAGHVKIDVKEMNIDMLALSAHKFCGPKGVGALYVRKGMPVYPLIEGGAQERGRRGGTENIPGIAGMAKAFALAAKKMEENGVRERKMRDALIAGLSEIPHARLNGDAARRLPGNVNFCFEGIEGESLLLLLDAKGIGASSGSACTSGSLDPSHVLLAIGLPHEVAHGSLRLTLSAENTMEEVAYMITEIAAVVEYLRSISPVWEELEKGEREHVIQ